MSQDFFPDVQGRIPFGGHRLGRSALLQGLRARPHRPRQADGGPPPHRGLLLALLQLAGLGRVRGRDLRPAVARPAPRPDGRGAGPSSTPRSSSSTKLGVPFFCFHDRDIAPEGTTFAETRRNLDDHGRRAARRQMAADRRPAAVGHRQPVQPPALRRRRGHQPGSRGLRLRRGPGQAMLEATHRLGGDNYVLWGGREGYETLLNTDLAREERAVRPVPDAGGGAQAPDRLQGHAADRAQAAGADQAPVRLRRARRSTASSSATGWRASTGQHRGQPRDAGRATASTTRSPTPSRTASSAASTPTAATTRTAGTPTSSRTRSTSCRWRCYEILRGRRVHHRRLQLRRQAAPPEPGPHRPVPRPHRRHRHPGPGAARRRRDDRATARSSGSRRGALRRLGGELGKAILPATRRSRSLAGAGRRRRDRPARCRAARSCWRTS